MEETSKCESLNRTAASPDVDDVGLASGLSREEEAILKTALAVVIVKQRWMKRQKLNTTGEQGDSNVSETNGEPVEGNALLSLCPSLSAAFGNPSSTPEKGKEEKEIENSWNHICHMMDALSRARADKDSARMEAVSGHIAGLLAKIVEPVDDNEDIHDVTMHEKLKELICKDIRSLDLEKSRSWSTVIGYLPDNSSHIVAHVLASLVDVIKGRLEGKNEKVLKKTTTLNSTDNNLLLLDLLSRILPLANSDDIARTQVALTEFSSPITDPAARYKQYLATSSHPSSNMLLQMGLCILFKNLAVSMASNSEASSDY